MRVVTALPLDDWRAAGEAAKDAEAAGCDGVMTLELAHDPFAPLVAAALATERVQLTTGIAVAFPRSPTVTAAIAWDLHVQSGGRFHLGLGSQVKVHNERRFGVTWGPPAPRLADYIEALHAIWRCWETGVPLDHRGEHYRLDLMTPEFSPRPSGLPMPPVSIAAVGPAMLRLAGRLCDGVRMHPICSRRYLEDVCLKRVGEGMARSGRRRENVEIYGGGFVLTGPDEAAVRARMDWARARIAGYGASRTYLPVLAMHGLEELGVRLHRLSIEGRWSEMAAEISDEVVHLFAAVGTYDTIVSAIERRFGGVADVVEIDFPAGTDRALRREIVDDIRRIPCAFRQYRTG